MILSVLVAIAGILSPSLVSSLVVQNIVIRSTGQILTSNVMARSGSVADIQAAVNLAAAAGGGSVYIPAGAFNFVEVGQPWVTVNVPAGVSIFGAKTQRDAEDQVVEWKTTLVMPYEVPTSGPNDTPAWFAVQLDESNTNKTFRFSDIKLVGWRFFNHSSTTMYCGLKIYLCPWGTYLVKGMQNIRVDHCDFQDMAGCAVDFQPTTAIHNRRVISGVIDHNRMVNSYGNPATMDYEHRTLGYGIAAGRWACDIWDYNLSNVIGQYTNYTVFIEDNYFSKWRHCVASNDGVHYVFRHNVVDGDYGTGSIDAHGSYADANFPYAVGTRAIEVYDNIFENPDTTWGAGTWAINLRGGSGIVFNNTLVGYYALMDITNDVGNYAPYCPQCHLNQTYIWNNGLGSGTLVHNKYDVQLDVNYFLREPSLAQDGFDYMPYQYPHPITLNESG